MKNPTDKSLFFFTSEFPYGKSETFIENEINYLARNFKKVYIIPGRKVDGLRQIPDNCELIECFYTNKGYSRISVLKTFPIQLIKLFLSEWSNRRKIESGIPLISEIFRMIYKAVRLKSYLKEYPVKQGVFYTYWMGNWTTLLSVLKSTGFIPNLVTRAHRFDLYEDKRPKKYIPYRPFQLKYCDLISIVSQQGVEYMQNLYPNYRKKIVVDYLGTNDYGFNNNIGDPYINIISISNVIEVKRVSLIVDLITKIKQPVNWIHFGDGELMGELKEKIDKLSTKHKTELKGRVSNEKVLKYLKERPISFLINVSSSEGLPVSIMEAISFGIPIIATDVGGSREIVTEETGYLLNENFDIERLALKIENELLGKFNDLTYRKGVRFFWKNKFNASNNYQSFINDIIE